MVRRLVQDEEIRAAAHEQQQLEACALAAGERLHRLAALLVGEEEPQERLHRLLLGTRLLRPQDVDRRAPRRRGRVLLREIPDADRRPTPDLPFGGRQKPRQSLHKHALSAAVSADHADPLATEDREVDVEQDRLVVEGDGHAAQLRHPFAATLGASQRESDLAPLEHRPLHFVHPVDPPLRVAGPDRVAAVVDHARPLLVAPDRLLEAGDLLLLGRECGGLLLELKLARGVVGRIVPGPHPDRAAVQLGDGRHGLVEQVAVVRDHDDGAGELADQLLKSVSAYRVEVRLGLVEEEQVGLLRQTGGERHELALAAGELRMRALRLAIGESERLQVAAHRTVEGVPAELVVLLDEPFLAVDRALHDRHVGDRLGASDPCDAGLELAFDPRDVRPGAAADLDRRARIGADELGQIGGDEAAPSHRGRRVGFVEAREDAKKRALARAVLADHADARALAHLDVEAPQHGATAVRLDGVAEADEPHRGSVQRWPCERLRHTSPRSVPSGSTTASRSVPAVSIRSSAAATVSPFAAIPPPVEAAAEIGAASSSPSMSARVSSPA